MEQHCHPHNDQHFSLPEMARTIILILKPPVASADEGTGCKWLLSAASGCMGCRGPGLFYLKADRECPEPGSRGMLSKTLRRLDLETQL